MDSNAVRHAAAVADFLGELKAIYLRGGPSIGEALRQYNAVSQQVDLAIESVSMQSETVEAGGIFRALVLNGWRFLHMRGRSENALRLLETFTSVEPPEMEALYGAATISAALGQLRNARRYYEQGLELVGSTNDDLRAAEWYVYKGVVCRQLGDDRSAKDSYLQAWQRARASGNATRISEAENELGNAELTEDNYRGALDWYQKSWETSGFETATSPSRLRVVYLNNQGLAHRLLGNYAEASAYYERALNAALDFGDEREISRPYHEMGSVLRDQGEYYAALKCYRHSLRLKWRVRDLRGTGFVIEDIAGVAAGVAGASEAAARFYGIAAQILASVSAIPMRYSASFHDMKRNMVRSKLGLDCYRRIFDEGTEMTLDLDATINAVLNW